MQPDNESSYLWVNGQWLMKVESGLTDREVKVSGKNSEISELPSRSWTMVWVSL